MPRRAVWAGTLAAALIAVIAVGVALHRAPSRPASARPNLVFILTDDLSWDLINARFAPHIVALGRRGETFDHYFVSDSLCCPSRATIFTGRFPHNTRVISNTAPLGGYAKFQQRRLDEQTFAVALQQHGYATSMLGKYLNGYGDPLMTDDTAPIPPGWSDWHVSNRTGYREFGYVLDDNGRFNRYGGPAGGCDDTSTRDDYGVDALAKHATAFIRRARGRPFAIEIATFAPHAPSTPAPRNACDFPGLRAPRDPSFNANNLHPPAWLGRRRPLSARQIDRIDADYRRRAQAVEAVDALLTQVEAELTAEHRLDSTYIVFSSDNGYHMGQHRLAPGKMTAFDSDIRVPLIIAGPTVPKGKVISQVTQNTDLYPTFVQLAGATPDASIDGRSLLPLLHGASVPWPTIALIEHRGRAANRRDPDYENAALGGNPTTYDAIRISSPPIQALYVRYRDPAHEREYYDIATDPFERTNLAGTLTTAQRHELDQILTRLARCHGARACASAALLPAQSTVG